MKVIKNSVLLLALATAFQACDKQDFVDVNKSPDALTSVPPQNQFLNATIKMNETDFDAFYEHYRRVMPWMQYTTGLNGNEGPYTQNWDNFTQRYGRLYNGVGDNLNDVRMLVSKLSEEEQPRYTNMIAIADIVKAYYAFFVSDIYGSIPYSEAFQGRYGGTLQPKYDTQQMLFATLDGELKAAIATLKQAPSVSQVNLGTTYDQYYGGDAQKWVKAANALRLRLAMRVKKADAAAANAIITEVLASPAADFMESNADGWVFKANAAFTGTGTGANRNPSELRAPKPMVDFMWEKKDPRIDAFFTPNGYSQTNINLLVAAGQLPAGTTVPIRRYVGSLTSPDEAATTANIRRFYTTKRVVSGTTEIQVDTLSFLQPRLFSAGYAVDGTNGTGFSYLPVITYAEYCFMRAELALGGMGSGTAKDWYEKGVVSSIQWYDEVGTGSRLTNYTAVTQAEIDTYLTQPGVAFDAAKGLDQIASQSYLNFMKQAPEGWALWKRTGYPNPTSVVPLPVVRYLGVALVLPRRAPLDLITDTDPNVENKRAAYAEMASLPGFGSNPADATGRVWWDKP
jgi:hypothetical protein